MPLPVWAQRVTLETLCDLSESGGCSLSVCSHRPAQWHGLSGSVENNSKQKQYDSSQSYMLRCVCAVPCCAMRGGRHSLRCWPCVIGVGAPCVSVWVGVPYLYAWCRYAECVWCMCAVCICVVSVCHVCRCAVCICVE